MKFGKVDDPGKINFTLPEDDPNTQIVLERSAGNGFDEYVGCAKWNKAELKGFYPKGVKDELAYYAQQFNCIELNTTFYNIPSPLQILKWKDKTPAGFRFFPKLGKVISHEKRLLHVGEEVKAYCETIAGFEEKLGMAFLQLQDNFSTQEFERLKVFIAHFPKHIPLGIELRSADWFANKNIFEEYCLLLEKHKIANIITDAAGRRDMLHMRLTNPVAFIRFVGCNDAAIDHQRLISWVARIAKWRKEGLQHLYFFVHQNIELSSTIFAKYFIEQLNAALGLNLNIPNKVARQGNLF